MYIYIYKDQKGFWPLSAMVGNSFKILLKFFWNSFGILLDFFSNSSGILWKSADFQRISNASMSKSLACSSFLALKQKSNYIKKQDRKGFSAF